MINRRGREESVVEPVGRASAARGILDLIIAPVSVVEGDNFKINTTVQQPPSIRLG